MARSCAPGPGPDSFSVKSDTAMLSDLEYAYNPVEQKVRDLQEYL